MIMNIDGYTCELRPVPADPTDEFGERNKDIFGEPHRIIISKDDVVLKDFTRRVPEQHKAYVLEQWVEHFETKKVDWTDFDKAVQLVINKINLFPKKERYLLNDRFADSLEKWCAVLCYFHPTWSGYDINPVCRKFPSQYCFQTSRKTPERQVIDAFIDAHK